MLSQGILTRIFPEHARLNAALARLIEALPENAYARRSHFIDGRYENLYLDARQLPRLEELLAFALGTAAQILQRDTNSLKLGFWLNLMQRGDRTSRHAHDDYDDYDEVLSGVYYLQVPPGAGKFRAYDGERMLEIAPVAGHLLFFPPHLEHEVSTHHDDQPRISIAFNIGPA